MHGGNCEVPLRELVSKEVNLAPGVAVDNRLCDGQCLVEVAERVELPLLLLDCHIELPDTLQRQLILLHQDPDGFAHELGSQLQNVRRHGGREEAHLHVWRQRLEDVVDLILEAPRQHLVSLIQHEGDEIIHSEMPLADHVEDPAGGADNKMLALAQLVNVVANGSTPDADMAPHSQVVAQRQSHLLDLARELACGRQDERLASLEVIVDPLQAAYGEGRGLACAGLCLADGVPAIQDGLDAALLDGAGLLEAVGIDPPEEALLQVVVVEGLKDWVLLSTCDSHTLTRHGGL
mmetsp:Transcript_107464/g.321408  ORF Transcript_107464/g.321408 Transcript_107464/m.321408 type:complete len:292 (-) Transcript_107464:48-923(-)